MCNIKSITINFAAMLKILFVSVLPSLLDQSSDLLNALDMVWVGEKWRNVEKSTGTPCPKELKLETFLNMCNDVKDRPGFSSSAFGTTMCGYISLCIVFVPGIVKAMKTLATHLEKREFRKLPEALIYLPFPIYILYVQIKALILPRDETSQQRLIRALSMEAFYESFPQLTLQIITIIYSYPRSNLQLISILFSTFMLAKTVIMLDKAEPTVVENKPENDSVNNNPNIVEDKLTCKELCAKVFMELWKGIKYMFWILPLYMTSVIYKVAAFSLTFAYLRSWAFATMGLLIIELAILAKNTGFKDLSSWAYPVFSNFFIVNIGGAHIQIRQKQMMNEKFNVKWNSKMTKEQNAKNAQNMYKFAKRSVIFSFIHHTLVIALIAFLVLRFGNAEKQDLTANEECNTTYCATLNVFGTELYNVKSHWKHMLDTLYPYCKHGNCDKLDDKLAMIKSKYEFMIGMSSVVLIGLINLILSIYSARDIKAKQDLENNSPKSGEESQRDRELVNGTQSGYVLCFDEEVSAVVTNNGHDPLLKITIPGQGSFVISRKEDSKVSTVVQFIDFVMI